MATFADMLRMMDSLPAGLSEREREARMHQMFNKIKKERTVKDTRLARIFYKNLDATSPPAKWTTLIRYPRIGGKRKEPGKDYSNVSLWEPGHELHNHGKCVTWACLGLNTEDECSLYAHHSIVVFPDGKLIGKTSTNPYGTLDVRDAMVLVEQWEQLLKGEEKTYWDEVEEGKVDDDDGDDEEDEDSDDWEDDDSEDDDEEGEEEDEKEVNPSRK